LICGFPPTDKTAVVGSLRSTGPR